MEPNDLGKSGATIGEALSALNEALKETKRLKGIQIFFDFQRMN